MNIRVLAISLTVLAGITGTASGQVFQRRANMVGGGNPDFGKCTIEVVVDGAADVEIRGDNATLRNLSGQQPQWRRFECTSAMPQNPMNFRFIGIDGRGSQELVRSPQAGGVAVVRINDSDGGAEGYTFDVTWGSREDFGLPGRGPIGRRGGSRITTEEAVRGCQEAVRRQAFERFRVRNIAFRRTTLDDNPGRRDFVIGLFDIRRGYDRDETYRFSCSTNFDTGEVRAVQIDIMDRFSDLPGGRGRGASRAALQACEEAVDERLRHNGYQHVDILSIDVDNNPGRNDWILGRARADIRFRSDTYDFSCSVNLTTGIVRSVDVRRR